MKRFFSQRPLAGALLSAVLLALPATGASAHDYTLGDLKIGHPWTRATPAGAKVAGGYLSVQNNGSTPDRLIGGSMEFAGHVEIHEMSMVDNIMRMRELPKGLEIPAGAKVELKPGSYHVMFMQLKKQLKEGDKVKGQLVFEKAGTVDVVFNVDSVAAKGSGAEHKH
ncbi:MAG: copper chaperone PCu(A)C [Bosea sp. (in: a-proteobacteria)]